MNAFLSVRKYLAIGGLIVVWVGGEAAAAAAESRYLPWEKGSLKIGGFITAFDSSLTFGLEDAGATIDGEDLLGLDDTLTVFRIEAMYRPGKSRRHQLDLTYAQYHRDGSAMLSKELEIDGVTYPIGARIDTVFNFDLIRGTYSYAFVQQERMRLALGLGVYAVPLRYGLEIESLGGHSEVEGADTTLPLPALALRADFQLVPRLFLTSAFDAMYLEVNNFKGSLLDFNVGLEYRPWNYLAFGVGYNGLSVQVEGEDDSSNYPGVNFVGNVDVRFNGLLLYGKLTF